MKAARTGVDCCRLLIASQPFAQALLPKNVLTTNRRLYGHTDYCVLHDYNSIDHSTDDYRFNPADDGRFDAADDHRFHPADYNCLYSTWCARMLMDRQTPSNLSLASTISVTGTETSIRDVTTTQPGEDLLPRFSSAVGDPSSRRWDDIWQHGIAISQIDGRAIADLDQHPP